VSIEAALVPAFFQSPVPTVVNRRMADGNAQVLRQLGPHWLECRDEQGIFYFNQVTQQSSDTYPAELMGGPMPQARIAQQSQSYTPPPQTSSYQPPQVYAHAGHATPPPPQAGQIYGQASYQPPPQQQQPHYAQPHPQNPYAAHAHQFAAYQQHQVQPQPQSQAQLMQQMAAQHQQQQQMRPMQMTPQSQMQVQQMQQLEQQPAVQKMQFGDWAVYEDELGRFYMHVPSGQQFEAPPPELMQAYQQYRAEQDQQHFDQLRQIEVQKQQIDQRLAHQTQALQGRYNTMGGA